MIDFEKYYISDADEFREGYDNSLKLLKELGKKELREALIYHGIDLYSLMEHDLAIFSTRLMNKLQEKKMIFPELILDRLKFEVKRILRAVKREKKEREFKKENKKVVVMLYSSSQTDTIFPVLKELKKQENLDLKVVSSGKFSQSKLQKEGISFNDLDLYYDEKTKNNIKEAKEKLKKAFKDIEEFKFRNKDLWKYYIPKIFEDLVAAIEQVDYIEKMIELENPDIIVSATDISICGKAEVLIAKKLGIPVIVSQHGAAIDCPYYQPTLADKFVVWGQETKEMLIRRGYDENKIFIAGSTKYDGIKIKEDIPKGEYILVALQMFSLKEQKEFLEAIVPALKDSGEKVCINLHPGQKKELVEEYLKKYNLEAEIIPGQPSQGISYFIENCKLLITVCSTVAIDAILMNKPVITVNLTGKPDLLPYAKYHSAIGVYKKDDVKKAIEKALHNPKEKKKLLDGKNDFLKNYINFGKGNASKKFVELILGMISKV